MLRCASEDRARDEIIVNAEDVVGPRRTTAGFKHAILGFWRDSPVPDDAKKHAVVGFIDIRDRLRTRIQTTTRDYEKIDLAKFPVPPGPGGTWVTFPHIVFEPGLAGHNHHHIKEFVKQRIGVDNEPPDEKTRKDQAAIAESRRCLPRNHPPYTPQPAVAYGPVIPDLADFGNRPELSRRRELGRRVRTRSRSPIIHGSGTLAARRRDLEIHVTNDVQRREHLETRRARFTAEHDGLHIKYPGCVNPTMADAGQGPVQGLGLMGGPQDLFPDHTAGQRDHFRRKQEATQIGCPSIIDAKTIGGVKYERKMNGFWAGKLVSCGTIITIEGEDYVEYRVLTRSHEQSYEP